jgi:hypothetical protein
VRLFDEIQEKSRQLAEASQHKSQFLATAITTLELQLLTWHKSTTMCWRSSAFFKSSAALLRRYTKSGWPSATVRRGDSRAEENKLPRLVHSAA